MKESIVAHGHRHAHGPHEHSHSDGKVPHAHGGRLTIESTPSETRDGTTAKTSVDQN